VLFWLQHSPSLLAMCSTMESALLLAVIPEAS
jgi:hypothetical protein